MCSLAYVHLFIYLYWRRWEWLIWHRATTVVPPLSTLTLMWWFRRQVRALGHCRVVHFPLPPLLITTTFRRQWLKWVKLPFQLLVTSYFIEGRNIQIDGHNYIACKIEQIVWTATNFLWVFTSYECWRADWKDTEVVFVMGPLQTQSAEQVDIKTALWLFSQKKKCHTPHPTKTEPSFRKPYKTTELWLQTYSLSLPLHWSKVAHISSST